MNYKIDYKLMGISWILLIVYLILFFTGNINILDKVGYQTISSLTSESMTGIMIAVTFLGSWISVVIICIICLIIRFKKGLFISLNVSVIWILNYILKNIIERPRPSVTRLVVETGFSFPSAHAMVSFGLFALIFYMLKDKYKTIAILIMIIPVFISITRVYLGVHYTSDVIGGCLMAFTYLCTVIPILKYHKLLPHT
ncbi:MAG: phosphatase PAP2 family protein [Coprobacillus sp.]